MIINKFLILIFILGGFIFLLGCTIPETNGESLDNVTSDEEQNQTINGEEEQIEDDPEDEEQDEDPEEVQILDFPSSLENNCIGFLVGSEEEIETISLVGAGWTRPHPGPFVWGYIESTPGQYDFSHTDNYVTIAQESNVALLPTIWPFADWDQDDYPQCRVSSMDQFYPSEYKEGSGIPAYRCKPQDMDAYKEFLSALVERYDGDGIDDMPGLELPVKYFEILNEPDMESDDLTFFVGNEADYIELLQESYETIKETCPDCKVVQAGCAGSDSDFLKFWEYVFLLGGGEYFDIANIHYISWGDEATLNVKPFKDLLDKYSLEKPIWVTEAEVSNDDVLESTQGAFDAGASKVFYVSFGVKSNGPPVVGEYAPVFEEALDLCID